MKIKITIVDQKGECPCHDFDTERGKLCPMASHVLFPMIDILRYGGQLKSDTFCCPDVDTINVFKIEKIED